MHALALALVLMATVLASAVLDQLLPRVSLPLIQIACGIAVALIAGERVEIALNPELFLVLFIAPLLFNEAREADKTALWKNRRTMLSFAIGLVVAIVLGVGFVTHALVPSIPLAAAFALGAALGPTDPIAVASISQEADIPKRQQTTLQGESLLNDASGIVSFQLAVSATVTATVLSFEGEELFAETGLGTFVLEAVGEFLMEFFGALLIGILFGYVLAKFANKVRDMGLENTTFHVMLEVLTPFVAYLLGEVVGVSGIILVVASGITMSLVPRDIGLSTSRMNIVSTSVWHVITFTLNGIVFVLLGTQLPSSFGDIWVDEGVDNFVLTTSILAITLVMHGIRFLWTLCSDAYDFHKRGVKPTVGERLRSAAIMTFAGSKGAITLAIMFSLPFTIMTGLPQQTAFPQRDLLISLSCGVILVSLLLATFIVPVLAPRKREEDTAQRERDKEAEAEIMRRVIEELTARQNEENRKALSQVIASYNDRLEHFKAEEDLEDESDTELRLMVLNWEQEYVLDLIEKDEVPAEEGYKYLKRVAKIESMLERGKNLRLQFLKWLRRERTKMRKRWNKFRKRKHGEGPRTSGRIIRDIQVRTDVYIIERLKEEMTNSDLQSEKISQLINEYERAVFLLRGPAPSITAITQNAELDLNATRLALRIELEQIQQAYEEKRISRQAAQKMREAVYVMQLDLEDYV